MRAETFWVFAAGIAAGVLLRQALCPGPRTIVIPENEPINAQLLAVWKEENHEPSPP
jgi:hypothetical protein